MKSEKSEKPQQSSHTTRKATSLDDWERSWRNHWSRAGSRGYELPETGPAGEEAAFLTEVRSPKKEIARLRRIQDEFIRGFKALYDLGPAVTVFGSARFKENHPHYRLAREVGKELAHAGFATLTGGGPGIMEAANRSRRCKPHPTTSRSPSPTASRQLGLRPVRCLDLPALS